MKGCRNFVALFIFHFSTLSFAMSIDEYILQHIDDEGDYLKALYRDTHVKLLYPRMASGHLQGRMLKMFVRMIRPRQVLEIGTYSGYSALLHSRRTAGGRDAAYV